MNFVSGCFVFFRRQLEIPRGKRDDGGRVRSADRACSDGGGGGRRDRHLHHRHLDGDRKLEDATGSSV